MLSGWAKNSLISRIRKVSKERSSIGDNPIVYMVGIQAYISGGIKRVYADRRKAHCLEFIL